MQSPSKVGVFIKSVVYAVVECVENPSVVCATAVGEIFGLENKNRRLVVFYPDIVGCEKRRPNYCQSHGDKYQVFQFEFFHSNTSFLCDTR